MEISCERAAGFALVTPGEVLTPGDARTLEAVLLQAFAEGDDAVVCDLTGAGPAPMLRPTLATVAERVRPWPATVLVLVGAPTLSALSPGTAVAARVPDAADLVAARPRPRGAREPLEPALEAPALARGFLRSTLRAWDAERYGDDALLVVDELVANAVLHAGTEIELRLALSSDRLGVAVADRSPWRPSLDHPVGSGEHGRGLLLVDAVAAWWHVLPRRDGGKVVRAALLAPGTSTAPSVASRAPRRANPRGAPS